MPKKYLQLEDTRVYYDQETGDIRLISKDPRLKGHPFQLNLLRDSDSTESIYRLLEAEDLLGEKLRDLPKLSYLPSLGMRAKLTNENGPMPNRDIGGRNLRFLIGETYDESYLALNLHSAPHTLISGMPGTGKSVLLHSLMEQVLEKPDVILCHIDLRHSEEAASVYNRFRFQDKMATDPEEALNLLRSIEREQIHRYEEMEKAGVNSWTDAPQIDAIVLAVDEVAVLFDSAGAHRREIETIIGSIGRLGRAAGIHLIVSTSQPDATVLWGELKACLGRRILMGSAGQRNLQSMALGNILRSENRILGNQGRGVIKIYDAPIQTFQGFAPS